LAAREVDILLGRVLDRVRTLDPAHTRRWFDDLTVLHLDGGSLGIGCPDEAKLEYLEDHCKEAFTRAAQQATGHLVVVDFQLAGPGAARPSGESATTLGPRLHPDYTFDHFVVGPSNRLAHASCVAISQAPGTTYNPLFLYGASGLGKTHLLHAVCHQVRQMAGGAVIELLTCEDFVNRFIRAIEAGDMAAFQGQFRGADVLVIDDVQFLSDREHSQEEFFHTFNALYNNGKQVILSADKPPGEIPSIESRLVSRLNWGLVARIDPPSFETRVAILKKKAHLRGVEIPDEVAEYVARHVQANIRELEGALTTIHALALTEHKAIRLELAQQALEGQIRLATRTVTITDIIDVVTRHFGVRLADVQSKRRSQSITEPRQICMYLARNMTRHSLEEIGGHLGGRDHTTVMHACAKISEARDADPKVKALLDDLAKQITQTVQS